MLCILSFLFLLLTSISPCSKDIKYFLNNDKRYQTCRRGFKYTTLELGVTLSQLSPWILPRRQYLPKYSNNPLT